MGQATFDDDDLFGEAADDMRSDVESSLAAAREQLPEADDVWETDADNVLGVLNGLKSALDTGDAEDHLREAKKWFTVGQRADAFEDADDLEAQIESVEDLLEELNEAREEVGDLTSLLPQLKGSLEDVHEELEAAADGGPDAEADEGDTKEAASDGGESQATLDDEDEEEEE